MFESRARKKKKQGGAAVYMTRDMSRKENMSSLIAQLLK